jgi:hypothetical protein
MKPSHLILAAALIAASSAAWTQGARADQCSGGNCLKDDVPEISSPTHVSDPCGNSSCPKDDAFPEPRFKMHVADPNGGGCSGTGCLKDDVPHVAGCRQHLRARGA